MALPLPRRGPHDARDDRDLPRRTPMRRRARVVAAAATLLAAGATAVADAASGPAGVNVQFEAFAPTQLDVLPGETVQWTNVSQRTHTVTSDDGSFDSGDARARQGGPPALRPARRLPLPLHDPPGHGRRGRRAPRDPRRPAARRRPRRAAGAGHGPHGEPGGARDGPARGRPRAPDRRPGRPRGRRDLVRRGDGDGARPAARRRRGRRQPDPAAARHRPADRPAPRRGAAWP